MSELIIHPNDTNKAESGVEKVPMRRRQRQTAPQVDFKAPDEAKKITKTQLQMKIESIKERDKEMVTGIFNFREKPNGRLQFMFQKYAEDGMKKYVLYDGKRYKIPRMVARHLNQNCYYVEYTRLAGKFGDATGAMQGAYDNKFQDGIETDEVNTNMYAVNRIHRTEFRSLEFMDDDLDAASNLTEVVYR